MADALQRYRKYKQTSMPGSHQARTRIHRLWHHPYKKVRRRRPERPSDTAVPPRNIEHDPQELHCLENNAVFLFSWRLPRATLDRSHPRHNGRCGPLMKPHSALTFAALLALASSGFAAIKSAEVDYLQKAQEAI